MVWFDLQLGNKHKVKYTPINPQETEYPDVDINGNPLERQSGSYTKGYFINKATGEKHDKAYKLVNGQVSSGWTGKIKEVADTDLFYVEKQESDDVIVEHTFLIENQRLYDELKDKNQAIIFAGWFGNGYKVYKCYITPSELYNGFCIMRCGRSQLSQQIKKVVGELTEYRELKKKLEQIELNSKKVNNLNPTDLLGIGKKN